MSIVAVHGPNTFGSGAIVSAQGLSGVVDPANGLKWDFRLDTPTTRSDQDFSWAFPTDGTPTPQTVADPSVVTYATAGSKTATLTVTNTQKTVTNKALTSNVATLTFGAASGFKVGQRVVVAGVGAPFDGTFTLTAVAGSTVSYACTGADVASAASTGTVTSASTQQPAAGTYQVTVSAVSGVAPLGAEQQSAEPQVDGQSAEAPPELPPDDNGDVYDPADYTVAEVVEYAETYPDQIDDLIAAEQAGKNRSTLINQLQALQPA